MVSDLNKVFNRQISSQKKSAIREVLKLTQRPDIISFAGGLPSPESFPVEHLRKIVCELFDSDDASMALQYGTTEGDNRLRELLVERYREQGLDIGLENLMITTASQQALDLLPKIFIDPGDKIICGLPSYLGGISAFGFYGARMEGVKLDSHGMRADMLEEKLKKMKAFGEKPKFIYTIPDFQNPAGITMPESRRNEIIDIARIYDVLIVEDSPYRELRFEGEHQKMIYALDNSGQVISLGTFSKILAPGFRIGWVIAHETIIDKLVTAKQTADLCTSPFVQKIAARYLETGIFDRHIEKIKDMYREKRDTMLEALKEHMPEGVSWTEPEGGLFLFVTLPAHMDSEKLFMQAIEEKVAFVLGHVFYCDGSGRNTMRLNFSFPSKEMNVEGIKRLARAIRKNL
ncbi:MAG: PLP-dependent aminotransferase family protein [Marinilabiliales bacterium]|nr:MAG: PLP-dependent aminotransferase family protein [Marinilabiliales bacterium]